MNCGTTLIRYRSHNHSMQDNDQTERKTVKTYVPEYQKENWRTHANELDMSMSEFVRCMVQAGRNKSMDSLENGADHVSTPGGNGVNDRILDVLETEDPTSFDGIVQSLTRRLESNVEQSLEHLRDEGAISQHTRGGFTRNE